MDVFLRFLLALLPILWLALALSVWKRPAYQVCPLALVITVLLALFYWKSPGMEVFTGGLEGALMALWPISLVIVAAVFTYNLTVRTGAMEQIKGMLTAVTRDKRVLVLLIAWGFGGFMEGMAGFGTAVAIPAGILCGLGFDPIFSALVCLVANATPTAFGSIGIPTITAASVAGLEAGPTAVVVVLQLALMVVLTPPADGDDDRRRTQGSERGLAGGSGFRSGLCDSRVPHRQIRRRGAAGGHRLGGVHGGDHPSVQAAEG